MQDAHTHELDYLVTVDDIAYLNHFHTQSSPALQRRRTYAGLVATMCGVFGFLTSLSIGGPILFFMALLIVTGVWTTLGGKRRGPTNRQLANIRSLYEEGKNRALFGHHHVRLLPDRIELTTEFSRGEFKWEAVERVVEDEGYVFIYVSALNAFVINKKYFTGEAQARAFLQQAQGYHEQALLLEGAYTPPSHQLPAPFSGALAAAPTPREVPSAPPQASRGALAGARGGSSGGTDGTL